MKEIAGALRQDDACVTNKRSAGRNMAEEVDFVIWLPKPARNGFVPTLYDEICLFYFAQKTAWHTPRPA